MKKIFLVVTLLCFCVSLASAQLLIGGKASGMGGAGVANVDDLAAAYYNPAALMRSDVKVAEVKVSLGAEYTDPTELSQAISNASNVAQFIANNYTKALTFTGYADGVIGVNASKVGISILPLISATLNKTANSVVASTSGSGSYATTLTLGKTLSVPFLPAALDVGVNAKYITAYTGALTTTGTAISASGSQTYSTGTGFGLDVGALTSFSVPNLIDFRVGLVARDLMQSVTYTNKSQNSYLNYNGTTAVVTQDAETTLPGSTTTADPSYALGAAATLPFMGLGVAGDLEFLKTATNTHLGLEYPLIPMLVSLRVGSASGPSLGKTTFGAKVNLPIMSIEGTIISDSKLSNATTYVVDINMGW